MCLCTLCAMRCACVPLKWWACGPPQILGQSVTVLPNSKCSSVSVSPPPTLHCSRVFTNMAPEKSGALVTVVCPACACATRGVAQSKSCKFQLPTSPAFPFSPAAGAKWWWWLFYFCLSGFNRNALWAFQGSHVYFSRPTETDPYVVSHEIFLVSCHQLYIDDEHC